MNKGVLIFALLALALVAATTVSASASTQAAQLRDQVPRYKGANKLSTNFSQDDPYWIGIVILAAVPLALAILVFVLGVLYCLLRLCGCCKTPPKPEGYTCKQRWVPVICLLVFLGLCFAFSVTGMTYNTKTSDVLVNNDNSILNTFPNVLDQSQALLNSVLALMSSLTNNIGGTIDQVRGLLYATTAIISSGVTSLTTSLQATSSAFGNLQLTLPGSGLVVNCTFCQTISNTVNTIISDVNTAVSPAINDANNTISQVTDKMVNIRNDIVSQTQSVNSSLADVWSKLQDNRKTYNDYADRFKDYDNKRRLGTYILFILPFSGVIFVLVGLIFKKPLFFTLNLFVVFLAAFFMWLLLAVHLPIATLLADACVYENEQEATLPGRNESQFKVANACLQNTSLIEAFNLTGELDFANKIQLNPPVNFTALMNFPALNSFIDSTNALDSNAFGVNLTATIQTSLNQLNQQLGTSYTEATISTLDPTTYGPNATAVNYVNTTKVGIMNAILDRNYLDNKIAELKNNVSGLATVNSNLAKSLDNAEANLTDVKSLIRPYIDLAREFDQVARCGFLGDDFRTVKDNICVQLADDLSVMSMCFFFLGIFTVCVMVFNNIAGRRVGLVEADRDIGMSTYPGKR